MTSDTTTPSLVTVEEAATRLRIGRTTAFNLVKTGQLRSVRIGSARRVPIAAVDEFITLALAREVAATL